MKEQKTDQKKIDDFLNEHEQKNDAPSSIDNSSLNNTPSFFYYCPKCHEKLKNRKDPCPRCGYQGYIPLSEQQTKKIRLVLFVIFLIIALIVYFSR